jgi:hypothetical protein
MKKRRWPNGARFFAMDAELASDIQLLSARHPDLAEQLRGLSTLEDVFRWLRRSDAPAIGSVDTIAQDEFSHDLLLELTATNQFLVLGAT